MSAFSGKLKIPWLFSMVIYHSILTLEIVGFKLPW
jgi:hypothetical protein